MKPLVSVLVLTYNHQDFLAECLDSVIKQTYTDWEVIVVDDGSTDKTPEIGHRYQDEHKNITYVNQENVGPFNMHLSYNKALKICKGEFVAILDGDDYWYPEKLEKQMTALSANPDAILSWGCAQAVDGVSGKVLRTQPKLRSPLFDNSSTGSILELLYGNNYIPALTIVAKTQSINAIGGFQSLKNLPLVDYPTLLELALQGEFAFVEEPLGAWRMYAHQVTKSHTVAIKEGLHACAESHYEKHKNNNVLSSLDWHTIQGKFKQNIIIAYARSGRYKLIKKDFSGARKDYIQALKKGGFKALSWKFRSLVGIIFSFLHLDVEDLSRLLGKTSYNS